MQPLFFKNPGSVILRCFILVLGFAASTNPSSVQLLAIAKVNCFSPSLWGYLPMQD